MPFNKPLYFMSRAVVSRQGKSLIREAQGASGREAERERETEERRGRKRERERERERGRGGGKGIGRERWRKGKGRERWRGREVEGKRGLVVRAVLNGS